MGAAAALMSATLTSEELTSGALTSGALTSGALTSGALTSEALRSLPDPEVRRDGLTSLLADGAVRSGRDIGAGKGVVSDAGLLPVLPALRDLLPNGALQRGSVVTAGGWNLLCLALAAGPVASGAWCAAAGVPELGIAAAADAGVDPARLLLIPDLGPNWPQVVASLLDGCDLVLLRPPDRPSAQSRRKIEAAVRRYGAVLLIAGDWDGANVRLRIAAQEWAGIGSGHGRLRGRRAQVVADGRGGWSRSQARWLWLPAPDGSVTAVTAVTNDTAITSDTAMTSAAAMTSAVTSAMASEGG